jgi:hypothetical protein
MTNNTSKLEVVCQKILAGARNAEVYGNNVCTVTSELLGELRQALRDAPETRVSAAQHDASAREQAWHSFVNRVQNLWTAVQALGGVHQTTHKPVDVWWNKTVRKPCVWWRLDVWPIAAFDCQETNSSGTAPGADYKFCPQCGQAITVLDSRPSGSGRAKA